MQEFSCGLHYIFGMNRIYVFPELKRDLVYGFERMSHRDALAVAFFYLFFFLACVERYENNVIQGKQFNGINHNYTL